MMTAETLQLAEEFARGKIVFTDFLPCPFCGNTNPRIEKVKSGYFVECRCGTEQGPTQSVFEAIVLWNTRQNN